MFFKYPSIENVETVTRFPTRAERIDAHSEYYITEKIDGCNLGIWIPRDGEPKFYSRNGENAMMGLYNFQGHKHLLDTFIACAKKYVNRFPERVKGFYFWGEYFGNHIIRRINYGDGGHFKFYDIMIVRENDTEVRLEHPEVFKLHTDRIVNIARYNHGECMDLFSYPHRLDGSLTLEDVTTEFPVPCSSNYSEDNSEGWVITLVGDGMYKKLKYKDPKFKEIHMRKKRVKTEVNDPEASRLNEEFLGYITENRAIGILSKTVDRDMSKLVRALIADAKTDFIADHQKEWESHDNAFFKVVFNAGSKPYLTMKKVVQENDNVPTE